MPSRLIKLCIEFLSSWGKFWQFLPKNRVTFRYTVQMKSHLIHPKRLTRLHTWLSSRTHELFAPENGLKVRTLNAQHVAFHLYIRVRMLSIRQSAILLPLIKKPCLSSSNQKMTGFNRQKNGGVQYFIHPDISPFLLPICHQIRILKHIRHDAFSNQEAIGEIWFRHK